MSKSADSMHMAAGEYLKATRLGQWAYQQGSCVIGSPAVGAYCCWSAFCGCALALLRSWVAPAQSAYLVETPCAPMWYLVMLYTSGISQD